VYAALTYPINTVIRFCVDFFQKKLRGLPLSSKKQCC